MIHVLFAATAFVTTIAGVPGVAGRLDAAASVALFNKPTHITVDSGNGDVYIVDRVNNAVRKLSGGVVSTYTDYYTSQPASFQFDGPMGGGIVIEPPGDYPNGAFSGRGIFIADTGAHVVEQRDIFGATFIHDLPYVGLKDAPGALDGDPEPPRPMFNLPTALALDRRRYPNRRCCNPRTIYIADTGNGSVRKLTRAINLEAEYYAIFVTTVARGFVSPRGLAVGPDGTLFVSDSSLHIVARVEADGTMRAVAGRPGFSGSGDGPDGLLNTPTGIDVDDAGNVYIADTGNSAIRRLRPDGVLETVAGTPGFGGYVDGAGPTARFNGPVGLQIGPDGNLIVADTSNHVIRKILLPPAPPRRRVVRH